MSLSNDKGLLRPELEEYDPLLPVITNHSITPTTSSISVTSPTATSGDRRDVIRDADNDRIDIDKVDDDRIDNDKGDNKSHLLSLVERLENRSGGSKGGLSTLVKKLENRSDVKYILNSIPLTNLLRTNRNKLVSKNDVDKDDRDIGVIDTRDIDNTLKYDDNDNDNDSDSEDSESNNLLLKLFTTLTLYSGLNQKFTDHNKNDDDDDDKDLAVPNISESTHEDDTSKGDKGGNGVEKELKSDLKLDSKVASESASTSSEPVLPTKSAGFGVGQNLQPTEIPDSSDTLTIDSSKTKIDSDSSTVPSTTSNSLKTSDTSIKANHDSPSTTSTVNESPSKTSLTSSDSKSSLTAPLVEAIHDFPHHTEAPSTSGIKTAQPTYYHGDAETLTESYNHGHSNLGSSYSDSGSSDFDNYRLTTIKSSDSKSSTSTVKVPGAYYKNKFARKESDLSLGDTSINSDKTHSETEFFDSHDVQNASSDTLSNSTTFTALDSNSKKSPEPEVGKTILQKSVVKNLDSFIFDSEILATVKDSEYSISNLKKSQSLKLKVADKLQKVFKLNSNDYFHGNNVAWLLKDTALQGNLYLTDKCLMYVAFLPKENTYDTSNYAKSEEGVQIFQQGALGMKTANYGEAMFKSVTAHRYWAVLRLDTLSLYSSSTELYFPKIIIDLKSCLKVEILEDEKIVSKQKSGAISVKDPDSNILSPIEGVISPVLNRVGTSSSESSEDDELGLISVTDDNSENLQDGIWLKLTTDKKTYRFYADNYYTARNWCNNLTKLIFRLQNSNKNQEVLIKVPISNITTLTLGSVLEESDSNSSEEKTRSNGIHIQYIPYGEKAVNDSIPQADKAKHQKESQIENLTFAFFTELEVFCKKFKAVVDAEEKRRKKVEEEFLHTSKLGLFNRGKDSLHDHKLTKTFSTLTSSNRPNQIFDQYLAANAEAYGKFLNKQSTESSLLEEKKPSKLKKISQSLNPRSILSKKKSDNPSIPSNHTESFSSSTTISSEILQEGSPIFCPRPFSLGGLRELKMEFEITMIDPRIAEGLYKGNAHPEDPLDLSNPLGLQDPGIDDATETQKTSALKSLGKSINVFSSVTKLFTSEPSHYYQQDSDDTFYVTDPEERAIALKRFTRHFAVQNPNLIASYYVCLQRTGLPIYGKLYIGEEEICFRSLLPGVSTKMILPLTNVEMIERARGVKLAYSALRVMMQGADEYFLEFGSESARDDCENIGIKQLEKLHDNENWIPGKHDWGPNHNLSRPKLDDETSEDEELNESLRTELNRAKERITMARVKLFEDKLHSASGMHIPIILENSPFFKTEVKSSVAYKFVLMTIGSRGDVQPYIALGKELAKEGHNVTIATHSEFEGWIRKHGLNFKVVAGNPAELMSLMVSHGSMSVSFLREAASKFKGWIVELLHTSWEACQGCDIIIESPSAMGGIHIAEALGVPYMRAFTMPWTKTRAYPHAFIVPDQKRGGAYNYLTHVMFEAVFWKGISSQVNKWRVNKLDLPKTSLFRLQQVKVPFLYNVSPSILPPAVDFPDWVKVTGYWFLDEGGKDYKPPKDLVKFLKSAEEDGKKVVYIGFGSIVVEDAREMTKAVVAAVQDADVRCILNKGWSDRLSKKDDIPESKLPDEIYNSGSIPHDWLFPRIDLAVHHGGSGTTGACLLAGTPTIIKPFFGDQFFYAMRVEDIGVGVGLKKLTSKTLSKAITSIVNDVKLNERVKKVSENIKKDNGKLQAIEQIYANLAYAENLIRAKQAHNENYKKHYPNFKLDSGTATPAEEFDDIFEQHMIQLNEAANSSGP